MKLADINVHPLCLGGNVFGWTADESESFAVLDAYAEAGGNFIDTADVYSVWVPGHEGGESETIIGRWMAARGNRSQMVIATKLGSLPGDFEPLSPKGIRECAEKSLRRLGTEYIDLYYVHFDNESMPLAETLAGFDALVREGKVRHIAASNYSAARLAEALEISKREGFPSYAALQPHYNLVTRDKYEGSLQETVAANDIACVPYFGLARGFLTGKYRPGHTDSGSPRAAAASKHLDDPRALSILDALDSIAQAHNVKPAAVALAWLAAQPTVAAPIASARTPEQLAGILPMATLKLSEAELATLTDA